MKTGLIEHVNVTVNDSKKTAEILSGLFDWKVRWQGPAMNNGYTVHVGNDTMYLALYMAGADKQASDSEGKQARMLNHIGIQVDNLKDAEARVIRAGYKPYNHGDYAPGKRFYFDDENGIEFEIVSYG